MHCGIKKCMLVVFLVFAASFMFAQEQGGGASASSAGGGVRESEFYYYNLQIVKLLNHPRGFYILYRTPNNGVGELCVPYEWFYTNDSRAIYNTARAGVQPYISFITNNGEFYQIKVHGSADKRDGTWGEISSSRVPDENFDVDSLTLQF